VLIPGASSEQVRLFYKKSALQEIGRE